MRNCASRRVLLAEVDKTLRALQNSSYLTKAEFSNCLLFIQNIFFAQTCKPTFRSLLNNVTSSPGFLGQWFNNLQRAVLLTPSVEYDKILCQQQLVMVNYASGFNQSETGKYFE